ncbi:hypothetical protein JCM10213_005289 [Rhodosporidiobolus nylandii]
MAQKAAPAPPSKRKASEIDDIFSAKKPKPSAASAASTPANPPSSACPAAAGGAETGTTSSKKRKSKKGKAGASTVSEGSGTSEVKDGAADKLSVPPKRAPVEVVDTSRALETYKPEPVLVRKALGADATEAERKAAEEEERFMDSRGTRRKTEDGLPIYDTTELKIGLGGDTELCPFDCDCCF